MNVAAKVALSKEKHPDFYCRYPRCLWRIRVCDPMTREMKDAPNCEHGYCPRHKHLVRKAVA